MKISLDLKKGIEENAAAYFEKAKKLKKKIEGAEKALAENAKKSEQLRLKQIEIGQKEDKSPERKKEWYEKFRWFISSEGFLVIGGRDATSNEVVIKKNTMPGDLVFHTDMAGSPFFVVKSDGKEISEKTKKEAADATCTFSRTWKLGLQTTSVFFVTPDQVSKKTKSGEYMGKGAFMIYGKTNYIENKIDLAVGALEDGKIMAGPLDAVKSHCSKLILLEQGTEKSSSVAKYIKKQLGGSIDEIIRSLPSGGLKVRK